MKEFEAKVRLNEENGGKTGELDIMSPPPFDNGYFNGVTFGITFKEPVYDEEGNVMGYLGIGMYNSLNYANDIEERTPVEHWTICLPTSFCVSGKKIYTYYQNCERKVKGMKPKEAIPLLQRGLVGEIYDEKGYLTSLGYEALDAIDSDNCPTLVQKQYGECKTCKHYVPYREQFSYKHRGDGYCKSAITTSEGEAYINCHDEWYCANYEEEDKPHGS